MNAIGSVRVLVTTMVAAAILGLGGAGFAEPPAGGGFEITRSTIDGGGVMRSTGGDFELSGTIGQPDAGVMTGGEFQLTGGFWFGTDPTDCNDDGLINRFDHADFTACVTGPGGGSGQSPCPCFDVDGDGDVTLGDFATLQDGFGE